MGDRRELEPTRIQPQGVEFARIMRLGEEIMQRFGDCRADAVDRVDTRPRLRIRRCIARRLA